MKYSSACLESRKGGGYRGQLKYKDAAGKWRKKSKALEAKGKRAAQAELEAWRAEMEAEAERAAGSSPAMTVSEYVAHFLDQSSLNVTPTTASGYRTLLDNSIAPYIGGAALADLDRAAIKSWVAELCRDKSRHTAAKAFVLLRSALAEAARDGAIAANPTDGLKKPKAEDKEPPNALDAAMRGRVAAFVEINPADPVSIAVRLALFTGMREAEICGLRWSKVDTEAGELRVWESLGKASRRDLERARKADGGARATFTEVYSGVYLKRPKNRGSERVVRFPEAVARALRARRAAMAAGCMAAGIPFDESLFVCGTIDGKPMHPHRLWKRWTSIAAALDLMGTEGRAPVFHDLRHTYATVAIAHGADVKTVSNQMGHSNAAMTLNTYATVDPDAARRTAATMGRVLEAEAGRAGSGAEIIDLEGTGTDGR